MASIRIIDILNKVYGPKGLPFPSRPNEGDGTAIAGVGVIAKGFDKTVQSVRTEIGQNLKRETALGSYEFLPVLVKTKEFKNGIYLPNPLVIITGEKSIVETDVVDVGTVFEKVFTRPYSISIICTMIGENGSWPESQLKQMVALWQQNDLVTIECALTAFFLKTEDNFIITNISFLDAQGAENVEIIQIDGKSNVEFKLELI